MMTRTGDNELTVNTPTVLFMMYVVFGSYTQRTVVDTKHVYGPRFGFRQTYVRMTYRRRGFDNDTPCVFVLPCGKRERDSAVRVKYSCGFKHGISIIDWTVDADGTSVSRSSKISNSFPETARRVFNGFVL